jgi:hypothetical protein
MSDHADDEVYKNYVAVICKVHHLFQELQLVEKNYEVYNQHALFMFELATKDVFDMEQDTTSHCEVFAPFRDRSGGMLLQFWYGDQGISLPVRSGFTGADFGWDMDLDRRGMEVAGLPGRRYAKAKDGETLREFFIISAIYALVNRMVFGLVDATLAQISSQYGDCHDISLFNVWYVLWLYLMAGCELTCSVPGLVCVKHKGQTSSILGPLQPMIDGQALVIGCMDHVVHGELEKCSLVGTRLRPICSSGSNCKHTVSSSSPDDNVNPPTHQVQAISYARNCVKNWKPVAHGSLIGWIPAPRPENVKASLFPKSLDRY